MRAWAPTCPSGFAAALLLLLVVLLSLVPSDASDFNAPHSHTGKVTPFEPGDPKVTLDSKATKVLNSGKPYQTQIQSGSGKSGRGLVVQDVHAPTDVVWLRILDYDNYAKMVPKTVQSQNYRVIDHKPSRRDPLSQTIYTRMKVGFAVVKLEFFVRHLYFPSLNSLTWTLDYTKSSDFDDSCGYWYVIPHPDRPDAWTRVYYSVEVSMFDWVPKFVVDFMSSKALTDATGWVKKFSEEEWEKDPRRKELERLAEGAAGSAEDADAGMGIKKKGGIFGLFHLGRRRKVAGENEGNVASNAPGAACDAATTEVCDNPETATLGVAIDSDGERKPSKVMTVGAGWVRVGLISLVSVLLVYNISLCLDRMSQ